MPSETAPATRFRSLPWTAAGLVVAATALVGCGQSDELAGVQEGRDALARLSSSAPDETRRAAYTSAQQSATADGAVRGSANVVQGAAASGLAQLTLAEAVDVAEQLGDRIRLIREVTLSHERAIAMVDEMTRFDATREIRVVDSRLAEYRDALGSLRASESQTAQALSAADAEIQALQDNASALREDESQLRDEALRTEVIERADVIRRANHVRRQADGVEREIDIKSLGKSEIERQLTDISREIQSNERLVEINEQSKAAMRSRADELARQAAQSRTRVTEVEQQLNSLSQELLSFLDTEFTNAIDSAVSEYEGAASRASGSGASRIASSGAQSIIQRGIANARMLEANALQAAANLAERLSSNGVSTALDAAALNARADEARAAAGEALESFARAASSAGRSDRDISSSIEAIEALANDLRGIEPQPEPVDDLPVDEDSFDDDMAEPDEYETGDQPLDEG